MKSKKKTVFFVDDHPLISEGLSYQLDSDDQLEISGTASTYDEAVKKINEIKPDFVVTDLSLGEKSGLDLIKFLKVSYPSTTPVVLSAHDELVFAPRCIKAGAKGYIMKELPMPKILEGIRIVVNGKVFLSDAVKNQMMEQMTSTEESIEMLVEELTQRELEVFKLIGEGLRPRHIADKLYISPRTVNTHCKNIITKLCLESMTDVIEKATEWHKQNESI